MMARAAIFESPAAEVTAETAVSAASAWPAPPDFAAHDYAAYRAEAERLRREAIRTAVLTALNGVRRLLTR